MIKKYFKSQDFSQENELTYSEAVDRGRYVICYYLNDTPDFAEIIRHNKNQVEIKRVVYYNRTWPDNVLVETHVARYANCPFDLLSPEVEEEQHTISKVYHYNGKGELQFVDEIHLDRQRNYLYETHKDANGKLLGTIEYERNPTGELISVRERNADGDIISEYFE